jgi:hypothetical protein
MSYKLTCSSAEDYVNILVDGTWPAERPEEIIVDMYNLWAKHHQRNLLIDVRNMEETPSVVRDYHNVSHFAEANFHRIRRIAVLDNLNRQKANDFFETTAANRGLRFRFFYADEQEAISWLLSEERYQT